MTEELDPQEVDVEEPPPLFKSWTTWYAVVLINLAVLVLLFYWFTKTFE